VCSVKRHIAVFGVSLAMAASMLSGAQAAATNDELLVDPTIPLGLVIGPEGGEGDGEGSFDLLGMFTSYELSSVLIRAEDRIAVINEERVRVGDSVGGARVTAIEPGHVTLNVNGKIETLELYGASIKTLVKGDE
jgi:hypothetical protein